MSRTTFTGKPEHETKESMSVDDEKITHAVDTTLTKIDTLSDPNVMTREEAIAFYDALAEAIDEKRRALKEICDG